MKIFIIVLGVLALSLPSQGNVRPYLQTLVKEHKLINIAATPFWRHYFPANKDLPPPIIEYIDEKINIDTLDPIDLREEDAMEKIESHQKKSNELREQWVEEFYPEPTEERVLEVLGEDAELRAQLASFLLTTRNVQQRGLQRQISAHNIFMHSFGIAMLVRAIDREDLQVEELQDKLNDFRKNNKLEFIYLGNGDTPHVPGREKIFYHGRDDYLLRSNHVKHPPLSGQLLKALWQRGYTDAKLTATMPPQVVNMLLEQNVLPDKKGLFSGYHPNFYFDLLSEPGIIGNFIPPVWEAEANDLEAVVMAELDDKAVDFMLKVQSENQENIVNLETRVEDLEGDDLVLGYVLATLDGAGGKDTSASLVQIVQLSRMGFRLTEIGKLTYPARDAIIVSGYHNRDAFTEKHGADVEELNKIVKQKGELVFFLLQQGIVEHIEDINPHHVPSHADMDEASIEARLWESYLTGRDFNYPLKLTGISLQGEPQP